MTDFDERDISHTRVSIGSAPDAHQGAIGHYLFVVEGSEPGTIIEVGAETLTIGRDSRQRVVFADTELSRLHARVSLVKGEVVAEDLGSTNGTFVDGQRLTAPTLLHDGAVLRLGQQVLKYERRERRDVERRLELNRDLLKASSYVRSLLPQAIDDGRVRVQWRFEPSAQLGGDAFGYLWLDPDTFVVHLLDVSGHGAGAAMHSVGVMNLLRQRALPGVDFADPGAVLSGLNDRFQMDEYGGMYFTMWYAAYRPSTRTLTYSAAGHHAAYLVPHDKTATSQIGIAQLPIGAAPALTYETRQTSIVPGSAMYVFSDGVFEIVTKDQQQWGLSDFLPHLLEPSVPGTPEPERLYQIVRERARPGSFEDDFSLLTVTFP